MNIVIIWSGDVPRRHHMQYAVLKYLQHLVGSKRDSSALVPEQKRHTNKRTGFIKMLGRVQSPLRPQLLPNTVVLTAARHR